MVIQTTKEVNKVKEADKAFNKWRLIWGYDIRTLKPLHEDQFNFYALRKAFIDGYLEGKAREKKETNK